MAPARLTLEEAAQALGSLRQRAATVLVAIDGPGGAGKSTLAAALARRLAAAVVAGDDFYRVLDPLVRLALDPQGGAMQYFDWERLRAEVLEPLREDRPARYRRFDWERERLGAEVEVPPGGLVLVEGVYTFRPELQQFYDWSFLVDSPHEERLRRQRARGENEDSWIARWDAAEQWYFANAFPYSGVDAVVSGVRVG